GAAELLQEPLPEADRVHFARSIVDQQERLTETMTHEMKSPLAAIRGAAELLQEPLPEADRVHFARSIVDQQERLTET
ncbi:two-component system sensor histidine kinase CreC, partial [Stenotrophomonas maltophilia]